MADTPQLLELIPRGDTAPPAERAKKLRDGLSKAGISPAKQAEAIAAWMQAGRPSVALIVTPTMKLIVDSATRKPLAAEPVGAKSGPSPAQSAAASAPPTPAGSDPLSAVGLEEVDPARLLIDDGLADLCLELSPIGAEEAFERIRDVISTAAEDLARKQAGSLVNLERVSGAWKILARRDDQIVGQKPVLIGKTLGECRVEVRGRLQNFAPKLSQEEAALASAAYRSDNIFVASDGKLVWNAKAIEPKQRPEYFDMLGKVMSLGPRPGGGTWVVPIERLFENCWIEGLIATKGVLEGISVVKHLSGAHLFALSSGKATRVARIVPEARVSYQWNAEADPMDLWSVTERKSIQLPTGKESEIWVQSRSGTAGPEDTTVKKIAQQIWFQGDEKLARRCVEFVVTEASKIVLERTGSDSILVAQQYPDRGGGIRITVKASKDAPLAGFDRAGVYIRKGIDVGKTVPWEKIDREAADLTDVRKKDGPVEMSVDELERLAGLADG